MIKLCCIDVGTNSVLHLSSKIDSKGRITPVQFHAVTTRLGKSLRKKGILNKKSQDRTISVIKKYARDADEYLIAGTSALREAGNRNKFIKLLYKETGQKIKILTEEEEAGLVFDSVKYFLKPLPNRIVICDIGGGSTEFIFCINGKAIKYSRGKPRSILLREELLALATPCVDALSSPQQATGYSRAVIKKLSIPIGAVNLTERFKNDISGMEIFIRSKIPLTLPFGHLSPRGEGIKLIGVGGTVTTLGAILKGLRDYNPKKVHKYVVPLNKVICTLKKLSSIPISTRKKIISFDPKRADIIVAGICILKVIMETLGVKKFRICDRGLVYGLAVNYSKYTRGTFNLQRIS